jgi:hypothetical protein
LYLINHLGAYLPDCAIQAEPTRYFKVNILIYPQ